MSDIVERLRRRNRSDGREVAQPDTLADEAAAEIERLRATVVTAPTEEWRHGFYAGYESAAKLLMDNRSRMEEEWNEIHKLKEIRGN